MNYSIFEGLLNSLGEVDPSPFFVGSLVPYLFFLYWIQKSSSVPKVSVWGFRLTLLFVAITIVLAIVAKIAFNDELTNVDPLHGAAEAFLTLSDGLILFGFASLRKKILVNNS